MKNKFIKPEMELLPCLCETPAPDSYNQETDLGNGVQLKLPDGIDGIPGGDLGVSD
jgi:hypothetical protein